MSWYNRDQGHLVNALEIGELQSQTFSFSWTEEKGSGLVYN